MRSAIYSSTDDSFDFILAGAAAVEEYDKVFMWKLDLLVDDSYHTKPIANEGE